MSLRAQENGENVVLAWTHEELPHPGEIKCRFHVHDKPLQIEDLDTGDIFNFTVLQRSFQIGPGLDINQEINLVSMIPGFEAVPASERRYALSIKLERNIQGELPDKVQVQLPDVQLVIAASICRRSN